MNFPGALPLVMHNLQGPSSQENWSLENFSYENLVMEIDSDELNT